MILRIKNNLPIAEKEALKKALTKWVENKKIICLNESATVEVIVNKIQTAVYDRYSTNF